MSEKAVRIAATLYAARDAMRTVLGPNYRERCAEWVTAINIVMQRQGIDVLDAALLIAKHLAADETTSNGASRALLFATAVEMTEGIFALPGLGTVVRYRTRHPAHPGKAAEGAATVVKYMTPANSPAPHMRPAERMLFVRECAPGPLKGQHHIIKASEVLAA